MNSSSTKSSENEKSQSPGSTTNLSSYPSTNPKSDHPNPIANTSTTPYNPLNDTATNVSFLLSNWAEFGLAERTFYHSDLITSLHKHDVTISSPSKKKSKSNFDVTEESRTISQEKFVYNYHDSPTSICGVSSLLECIPFTPMNKRTKRDRRHFRERHRDFNLQARRFQQQYIPSIHLPLDNISQRENAQSKSPSQSTNFQQQDPPLTPVQCHRPTMLPLPISHMTRVSFAYEVTKMVLCIDASPNLTSTFGFHSMNSDIYNNDDFECCCAMDRIGPMLETYLTSLLAPIPVTTMEGGSWIPEIAITVIAVYSGPDELPQSSMKYGDHFDEDVKKDNDDYPVVNNEYENEKWNQIWKKTSVLVSDYRMKDKSSAKYLSDHISRWANTEVENTITARLSSIRPSSSTHKNYFSSFSPSQPNPLFHSDLREILQVCSLALDSSLPTYGRPMVVVLSDCRSVFCGNMIDYIISTKTPDDYSSFRTNVPTFPSLVDVPIHIMNLLPPSSSSSPQHSMQYSISEDNTEALCNICEVSHGCFLNSTILNELAHTIVGQVPTSSPLHVDNFVSHRKRGNSLSMRPNTLQWYTFFSLSALTPLMNHISWGWMAYLPERMKKKDGTVSNNFLEKDEKKDDWNNMIGDPIGSMEGNNMSATPIMNSPRAFRKNTMIHSYSLSPIRIQSLLYLRAQQNFRAKYLGGGGGEDGKLSVHFMLPLDSDIIFHYELSFTPTITQKVGLVQIKLGLSGDLYLIHDIKQEFLTRLFSAQKIKSSHTNNLHTTTKSGNTHLHSKGGGNPINHQPQQQKITLTSVVSSKICKFLQWIKREDELEKELCMIYDSDLLESKNSNFLRLLDSLRLGQRYRHFETHRIDVVYKRLEKEGYLNDQNDIANWEHPLRKKFADSWAHLESEENRYVKVISSTKYSLVAYCMLDISQSQIAAGLYHIFICLCGIDVKERLLMKTSILKRLHELENVIILPKSLQDHLITIQKRNHHSYTLEMPLTKTRKSIWMKSFKSSASWDLDNDPNLLSLLIRRRMEIANYWIIELSSAYALLAKYKEVFLDDDGQSMNESKRVQLCLIQCQLYVDSTQIYVQLHMEIPGNSFSNLEGNDYNFESRFDVMSIFNNIKHLDDKCADALRSRRRLINLFDPEITDVYLPQFQQHDVQLLLPYCSRLSIDLRFFSSDAERANSILSDLTYNFLLSFRKNEVNQVVKLGVSFNTNTYESLGEGVWFLLRHNESTHSFIQFPDGWKSELKSDDSERDHHVYQEAIFFTFTIDDLYCPKNEAVNVSKTHSISEVHELRDVLKAQHKRNYSCASFMALRRMPENGEGLSFSSDDFQFALQSLSEIEVANSFVTQNQSSLGSMTDQFMDSSLYTVFQGLLQPIPGGHQYFYFCGKESNDIHFQKSIKDTIKDKLSREDIMSLHSGIDEDLSDGEESLETEDPLLFDDNPKFAINSGDASLIIEPHNDHTLIQPPVFVKFNLDGRDASKTDLESLSRSSNVKVFITVFTIAPTNTFEEDIPDLHACVSLALRNSLDAHVASLTLKRLNNISSEVPSSDIKAAMKCLIAADSVTTLTIPIELFSSKLDCISIPSGQSDDEIKNIFFTLRDELDSGRFIHLMKIRDDTYYTNSLRSIPDAFWAFIQIHQLRRFISVLVYHPNGIQAAAETREKIKSCIENTCHRVNQLLLLQR